MENETQKPETKWFAIENIIKGEILSLIGLVILGAVIYDFFSKDFDIPSIDGVERKYELIGLLVISIVLFMAPNDIVKKCKDILGGYKPTDPK